LSSGKGREVGALESRQRLAKMWEPTVSGRLTLPNALQRQQLFQSPSAHRGGGWTKLTSMRLTPFGLSGLVKGLGSTELSFGCR
jgi:hypothetical protein